MSGARTAGRSERRAHRCASTKSDHSITATILLEKDQRNAHFFRHRRQKFRRATFLDSLTKLAIHTDALPKSVWLGIVGRPRPFC